MDLAVYDLETQKVESMDRKDFMEKLEKLKALIEGAVEKLESIGSYTLDTFTASIGMKAGVFIFTVEGGIELSYKK